MADVTRMFVPHQNLSDQINRNIIRSEIEGGVYLKDLPDESELEVRTRNRGYTLKVLRDGQALISGHPEFCPEPVLVAIAGSTWGGSMLKLRYIGRGMHLEFCHPEYRTPIITSRIQEVRERIHLGFEDSSTASENPATSAQPMPPNSTPTPSMLARGTFTKPS